nr:DNA-processing protein DprA [Nocardiopsis ansamitocini]
MPGDPLMRTLLEHHPPELIWSALRAGSPLLSTADDPAKAARLRRWQAKAKEVDTDVLLTLAAEAGIRLVVPSDPEWPSQLESLGPTRPCALWVRGAHDLRNACLRSVAVVGARAATAYGLHVAGELSHTLSERGWSVVSGGAYGIDGAAHRGALAGSCATVVVLACGLDVGYPRGHDRLFTDIAERGVLVSEHPPGAVPTRKAFLVRNRIIAALTPGTVVVEAGTRSGAINTATHARDLLRVLMAVPGPVTSALSAGCHRLLRDWQAVCVTDAHDIIEQVGHIGADLRPDDAPLLEHDDLDATARTLVAALSTTEEAGAVAVASATGLDLDAVLRGLGLLAAAGHVERVGAGWRVRSRKHRGSQGRDVR